MKYLSTLLFCTSLFAVVPSKYEKTPYTEQNVERINDDVLFAYKFKDHKNVMREFSFKLKQTDLERRQNLFGSSKERGLTNSEIQEGYLTIVSKFIEPDYSRLAEAYKQLVYPIYQLIREEGLDKREELVLLLRFLQDYPYGIPPKWHEGRFINGLFTPGHAMLNKWADCDSKTLWMASVLANHPHYYNKMAVIHVPGHALLGIEDVPRPYEKYIEHQGRKYIYIEPVGLRRTEIGQTNSPYSVSIDVRPLKIFYEKPQEVEAPELLAQEHCPEGTFLLDYKSNYDQVRTVSCKQKAGASYQTHGWEFIYDSSGSLISKNRYEEGRLVSSKIKKPALKAAFEGCESDYNPVKYSLPGTNLTSESCVKLESGVVVRHGKEVIRNPAGEIVKTRVYDKGKMISEN